MNCLIVNIREAKMRSAGEADRAGPTSRADFQMADLSAAAPEQNQGAERAGGGGGAERAG